MAEVVGVGARLIESKALCEKRVRQEGMGCETDLTTLRGALCATNRRDLSAFLNVNNGVLVLCSTLRCKVCRWTASGDLEAKRVTSRLLARFYQFFFIFFCFRLCFRPIVSVRCSSLIQLEMATYARLIDPVQHRH